MRKVALVFFLAIFLPSLVLAWLAVRSLRDQQFVLERQQSLLYKGIADSIAKEAAGQLAENQRSFARQIEVMLAGRAPVDIAEGFDEQLRQTWPLADVGFVVSLEGRVISPSLFGRAEARRFRLDNDRFLCNRESVEVYWNSPKGAINLSQLDVKNSGGKLGDTGLAQKNFGQNIQPGSSERGAQNQIKRSVIPQQQAALPPEPADDGHQYSKVTASEAEFRQLIGDASEGTLARFLQNKLKVLFWYRSPRDPQLVFGAELDRQRLTSGLRQLIKVEASLAQEICVALIDDAGKPVAISDSGFRTNWRRPFIATEIGESLPHWEIAVYLLNPTKLTQTARALKWTLGPLIGLLLLAIGIGSWLIVVDLRREMTLSRQKTDFVSNVSHELKTPLTSIRMFSELLSEGRVVDPAKQRSYLQIITAETARLTRLINNVLDFSSLERGEKKYNFHKCDLVALVRETVEAYRPHLETCGFELNCELPDAPLVVRGDRDALAQVLVNLLSNAEKYSGTRKEIDVRVECLATPSPLVQVKVLDRGLGILPGCEEKIFEQFYRAHDCLSSGIQGSGLGLTLARQIARAHGGEVIYEPREGAGSCFVLRLPHGAEMVGGLHSAGNVAPAAAQTATRRREDPRSEA